jgi:GT2 family glycosyltransferase
MARFVGPENDYRPLMAVDPGEPRLSVAVVIPAYNRPAVLRRTLAALCAQRGYPPHLISVVVADDGSEEDLAPLIDEASRRLHLTFVRQLRDGYGVGRARNLAVDNTDAEVILFVDGDCMADPELVARHMEWHHRADNLLVLGSRQRVDSTDMAAEAIATGEIDLRAVTLGKDLSRESFDPNDWRRTFYRRTARLRHGTEAFRAALTHNCSLRRDRFLEIGSFSLDFKRWGGEDTELGWRAFAAGMFIVPENQAIIYHQEQEESHAGEGWRKSHRAANADLIAGKIPHPFYRRPGRPGPFQVPKVSWIVTTPAGTRGRELLSQMQRQTTGDWDAFFPFDPGLVSPDPRLKRHSVDGKGDRLLLDAVATATGEYLALTAGSAGLDPLLLQRTIGLLDASPRASLATVGCSGAPEGFQSLAGEPPGLPAFCLVRRREWAKVLPTVDSVDEAWQQVRALSWRRHLDEPLVTLPLTGESTGSSLLHRPAEEAEPGRHLMRLMQGAGGKLHRKLVGPRPVLVHLGSPAALKTLRPLVPWARLRPYGSGKAVLVGPGIALDSATLDRLRALDNPRLERVVLGACVGDGPGEEWVDLLSTCLFVAVASEDDVVALRSWGYQGPAAIIGNLTDHQQEACALLKALREEIS